MRASGQDRGPSRCLYSYHCLVCCTPGARSGNERSVGVDDTIRGIFQFLGACHARNYSKATHYGPAPIVARRAGQARSAARVLARRPARRHSVRYRYPQPRPGVTLALRVSAQGGRSKAPSIARIWQWGKCGNPHVKMWGFHASSSSPLVRGQRDLRRYRVSCRCLELTAPCRERTRLPIVMNTCSWTCSHKRSCRTARRSL
jgi:hypothetical protein